MPAAGSVNGALLRAAEPVISVFLLTERMCDAPIHRRALGSQAPVSKRGDGRPGYR
jgi:hypothetical protein